MAAGISAEALERRRRLTLRWMLICATIPLIGWPLALQIGDGSENRDAIAGALMLAGLFALGAVPFVLGSWRSFMARTLLDALVAEQRGMRHIDGDEHHQQAAAALASPAFDLGAFDGVGLVEPFRAARIAHVLHGEAEGIPFALSELRLYNQEGFEVFAGVLGSFRLRRPCPGLTLVTRERGLLRQLGRQRRHRDRAGGARGPGVREPLRGLRQRSGLVPHRADRDHAGAPAAAR